MEETRKKAYSNDWRKEPCSIFRVPTNIRWFNFKTYKQNDICNGPYDPKFVSIGPYHHGKERLQPLEEFKWRALHILLNENEKTTTFCFDKMKNLEQRARSCYSEVVDMSSDEFVWMMLLEGCFILFILHSSNETDPSNEKNPQPQFCDSGAIAPAWPIFNKVMADLLLLENQIPFFVLWELFKLVLHPKVLLREDFKQLPESYSVEDRMEIVLVNMALGTLIRVYPGKKYYDDFAYKPGMNKIHHFLHLFYLSIALSPKKPDVKNPSCASKFKKKIIRNDPCLPTSTAQNEKQSKFFEKVLLPCIGITKDFFIYLFRGYGKKNNKNPKCIPNVTDLDKIGVKFIPKYVTKTFLDVTFDYQKGVMEIPPLILYPYTQTTLRNIIAFEQCFGGEENLFHISHYVIMMAFLICTTRDILKLQDEEIITNWLGSQQEVLNVFEQLRSEVVDVSNDHYAIVYQKVNQFRLSKFNRCWMALMNDYFGTPWSFLAVLGAITALLLTFLQTFVDLYIPSDSTG